VQKIIKAPEMLTIYLDRIAEEEDGFKKVIKKPIKFSTNELLIEGIRYKLTGVTSIEGEHLNIRHKSYILKEEEWYEYDGKLVRLVDSRYM
jgi:ubiquitin C-terminal hydrolase